MDELRSFTRTKKQEEAYNFSRGRFTRKVFCSRTPNRDCLENKIPPIFCVLRGVFFV